jgi:hypothetical protein
VRCAGFSREDAGTGSEILVILRTAPCLQRFDLTIEIEPMLLLFTEFTFELLEFQSDKTALLGGLLTA